MSSRKLTLMMLLQYPEIKSYFNQCFQVSRLLKYDCTTSDHTEIFQVSRLLKYDCTMSDHTEIFQSHVVKEMWATPDCFV